MTGGGEANCLREAVRVEIGRVINGHEFQQLVAGAVNAAFYRAHGAAAHQGCFLVGETFGADQDEGFALIV